MATANERMTHDEEAKLELLRAWAKEGFDQLDRGEGIILHGPKELADFLAKCGRSSAEDA